MKERPILFSGPMVRAMLDGTKTQTRRVIKPAPCLAGHSGWRAHEFAVGGHDYRCPYGIPGDRLWVRETWAVQHEYDAAAPSEIGASARWHYAATEDMGGLRKRPSIFLPRRGCRILLEITDVRVQRLQEISTADVWAEGISASPDVDPVHEYHELWDSLNESRGFGWADNPWVWAITFRRVP